MATTPPNPFDPQEVQKYLDRKDAAEAAKSRRAEELADEDSSPAVRSTNPAAVTGRADLMGADTPTDEAVEMISYWKARGPEVYAEAVGALIDAITTTADELKAEGEPPRLDPDAVLTTTRLGKTIEAAGKKLYAAGRVALWQVAGRSPGRRTTPGGGKYTFKAPLLTRTRVDSKRLKAEYPDVYAAVAKTTTAPADTPGTLYL